MAVIAKQRYKLDIAPKGGWVIVYASQHDDGAREIEFEITNQGRTFSIPASINVSVQGIKSNKSYFSHSCSYSGNIVTMALADDMTDVIGKAICVLKFTNSSQQKLATAKFILNVDSDSSSEGIIIDTEAEEIFNQMLNEIRAQAASVSADIAELQSMVGSPLVASTVSAMTDHNKIYVYTGSQSGYINGNWYYWNGSAWTSGGVYNSTAFETDPTLTQSGQAADAYAVGNEFNRITATTKNLWFDASTIDIPNTTQKGIVSGNGFIQFLLYKPLPAGTYTLSCELESDFSATTYCKMRFSASQNVNAVGSFIGDANIEIGTGRKKYTFTLTQTAYSVRVLAGTTTSNAAGHTAVWKNIQIEVGNEATYYIPAVTARDFFAVHALETFINASNIANTYGDANDLPPNSIVGVSGAAGMLNYPPTTANCEIITLAHIQEYGIVQVAIPINGELDGKIYHRGNPSGEYTAWVSSAKDIFETNDVEVYADFQAGYIDTSGNVINPTPVSADRFYSKIITCSKGDEYIIEACGGNASRLQYTICDASYKALVKSGTMSETNSAVITYNPWTYKVTIPAGGAYLIVNHHHLDNNSYVTPRVYRLSNDSIKNYIATYIDGTLPYRYEAWKRYVVAAYESMIVMLRSGKFRLSTDCGKTWNTGVDVSGISGIQRAYLFANGNLAFYTDTKAYYIEDWATYHEAECLEKNGTAFSPSASTNFVTYWSHAERKFINGVDMYVFGTYKLVEGERVLIWYTIDSGKTYKVMYEFNVSGAYNIRHVHDALYYEPEDTFIITTGDSNATECMVFLCKYDDANDTWLMQLAGGPARAYKWAGLGLWNDEIYYCNDNTPGSVWKCKFGDIGDLSKHICVIDGIYCDPVSVNFGKKGDMLITQAHVRNTAGEDVSIPFSPYCASRVMYYSSDRKHFSEVIIPIQVIKGETYLSNFLPVTSDGHLICGIFAGTSKLPSVYVDEFIRIAGFKQAFSSKF